MKTIAVPVETIIACARKLHLVGKIYDGDKESRRLADELDALAAAPPQPEPADQLVLPEIIGPCSEIVERITDELGDIEGCETDQELVTQVLRAIRRVMTSGKVTNVAAPQPEPADQQRMDIREVAAYAKEMGLPTEFPEPADHRAALNAIINAGSIGQARRIAMQALGTNAAAASEQAPIESGSGIAQTARPLTSAAAPDGILCQARGDWGCNHTGTCASVNNAAGQDVEIAGRSPHGEVAGSTPARPVSAAPASTLPLSAEQINEQLKGFHSGFYYDVLQQAMRAIELERQVNSFCVDYRLKCDAGTKRLEQQVADAKTQAENSLSSWLFREKELEQQLAVQAEWGVNQFDRAEKAVAAVAEKDREIARLKKLWSKVVDLKEKVEAELAELKARVKP